MCRERKKRGEERRGVIKVAAADKAAHAPRRSARAAAACHIFRTVLTPVGMFGISINPRIKRARAVLVLLSCVPPLYHHAVTLLYLLICKVERKLRLPAVRAPTFSLDAPARFPTLFAAKDYQPLAKRTTRQQNSCAEILIDFCMKLAGGCFRFRGGRCLVDFSRGYTSFLHTKREKLVFCFVA
jgi:hypothetical protein